jgi:two-component system NarL family sensor kinase
MPPCRPRPSNIWPRPIGTRAADTAIVLLGHALALSGGTAQAQRRTEILRKLSRWHAEQGDPVKALELLRAQGSIADSLAKAKFGQALAAREVLFGTERKEHRIAEQQQALELAQATVRRKNIQRTALALAVVAASVIALLLARALRVRRKLEQKQQELHLRQVDDLMQRNEINTMNAMLEGQEKERDRMAKDLHDRLGAMLSTIKLQLGALEEKVELVHDHQRDHYANVARMLDEAVGEVRRIAYDMNSVTLSRFGLAKALEQLCASVRVNGRLTVELHLYGLERRMDRSLEIVAYRIAQELISNVLKHARAKEIEVSVTREAGRLSLMVSDDGAGFNPAEAHAGIGLENVRSRAASIGASVRIDSSPGHGTTVSVEGPVLE